jgi:ribosomal protein S18 acetylase RimI-like enzyme
MRIPGAECLVATSSESIVGYVAFQKEIMIAEVLDFVVMRTRSWRQIVSILLVALESDTVDRGMECVNLRVVSRDRAAIALFRKHRFKCYGEVTDDVLMHKHFGWAAKVMRTS